MKCFRTLAGLTIAASTWFASTARADILTSPNAFSPSDSVITFEGDSTNLPNIPGVQFPFSAIIGGSGFGGVAPTVTNGLFGRQVYGNLLYPGGYSDLAITFSSPQEAVGAYAGKAGDSTNKMASSLQVRVFDASNNLLDSTTLVLNPVIGGKPFSFVGFYEPAGISRIEWLGGNTGFFGVDNVTYGAATPEPTSLTIAGLGIALLLSRRRKHA